MVGMGAMGPKNAIATTGNIKLVIVDGDQSVRKTL